MRRFCLGIALLVGIGVMTAPATAGISEFLELTPEEATNPVGTDHTVTATVTGIEDDPRSFRLVQFAVTVGPNIGEAGQDCTDQAGQATFTYTGDGGAGTDTITATVIGSCDDLAVNTLGNGAFDTATKTWFVPESPAPPPAAPPSPPPAAGEAPSGALPFTGFPVWIVLLAGAGLIGAGAWLVPRARKTQ
jgi:hypothetical protein